MTRENANERFISEAMLSIPAGGKDVPLGSEDTKKLLILITKYHMEKVFSESGCRICEMYDSSECGPVFRERYIGMNKNKLTFGQLEEIIANI